VIRVDATVEDAVDERKCNGLEVRGGMKWACSVASWLMGCHCQFH
jgi:hypothetical protein